MIREQVALFNPDEKCTARVHSFFYLKTRSDNYTDLLTFNPITVTDPPKFVPGQQLQPQIFNRRRTRFLNLKVA